MVFYPNKATGKGFPIIFGFLCILFIIIWFVTKSLLFIILGIVFFLLSIIWISPFFIGNKSLEIKDNKVYLIFSKMIVTFEASHLLKIFIRKNGTKSYYFLNGKFGQRITPRAYFEWESLQKEFDRLFKPVEKKIQVINENIKQK